MKPSDFATRVVELMERREGIFANRSNVEDWVPSDLDPKGKACFFVFPYTAGLCDKVHTTV